MVNVAWAPDQPYNNIPTLPPKLDLETKAVLKQCIVARAALAELKQAAELIPGQGMLINTLPLLEARASSEIENIVTTSDKLFQHLHGQEEHADSATKEAIRYSHALLKGYVSLRDRPLNTSTAEAICSQIKGVEMTVRKDQFEATHPFTDGNGRTGRVLNSLFLIQENLLTLPILYLSRYIIVNKTDYYRLLLKVTTEQAWEEWLIYMLKGIEETAIWTVAKIRAIRILSEHTKEYVRLTAGKIYSHELVNLIFELPYCRIHNLDEAGIAKRQAASSYLKKLVSIGVLTENQVGREKLFIHPKLMQLLTREGNTFVPYQ